MATVNVLMVDDNVDDVALATRIMERAGMSVSVTHASDRKSFDRALADRRFDVILCDSSLPFDPHKLLAKRGLPYMSFTGHVSLQERNGAAGVIDKRTMHRDLVPAVLGALVSFESVDESTTVDRAVRSAEGLLWPHMDHHVAGSSIIGAMATTSSMLTDDLHRIVVGALTGLCVFVLSKSVAWAAKQVKLGLSRRKAPRRKPTKAAK